MSQMHVTGIKWVGTDPNFLVANQTGQVESSITGSGKTKEPEGRRSP